MLICLNSFPLLLDEFVKIFILYNHTDTLASGEVHKHGSMGSSWGPFDVWFGVTW